MRHRFVPSVDRLEPVISQSVVVPTAPPKPQPHVVTLMDGSHPTQAANSPVIPKIAADPQAKGFLIELVKAMGPVFLR